MQKLIRITTIPSSMQTLLKGQLRCMSQYYEVIGVSSNGTCFDEMIKEQNIRGVKVDMTRQITPVADLKALFRLVRLFLKEQPGIVHTHTPKAGTLGMLAAWITRVPCRLHTVAGLPLLVATGKKRILLNWVERLTYACATKVYPNSFVMKQVIIDNHLAKESKLKVIANGSSNGIDTAFFSLDASFDRREKEADVFTFCFVGRIVKDKGINELIHAFTKLYQENDKIRLLLVGPFEKHLDPILPDVEEQILDHPAIHFMDWQSDVRPFLAASDALVFPSYREGFPNVVMQAGAMGLPSIVTDINGCNEIIVSGKNGVIIPPKDEQALYEAMFWFLAHPDKVEEMAANARPMIASRYDQKIVWEALLAEYKTLTGCCC